MRYQLAFCYWGEGITPTTYSYTEKLEVKAVPTATPAGQVTTIYTNAAITNTTHALANATSVPAVVVLQPGPARRHAAPDFYYEVK